MPDLSTSEARAEADAAIGGADLVIADISKTDAVRNRASIIVRQNGRQDRLHDAEEMVAQFRREHDLGQTGSIPGKYP